MQKIHCIMGVLGQFNPNGCYGVTNIVISEYTLFYKKQVILLEPQTVLILFVQKKISISCFYYLEHQKCPYL